MGGVKNLVDTQQSLSFPATKKAVQSSVWILLGFGASQTLRLLTNLLLARLLFPGAFGFMALVGAFIQGLQMFSDLGIGPSIIQNHRGTEPAFLHTAWTLQLVRGLFLWALSWLIAIPVAAFYPSNTPGEPSLSLILPIVGATAFINGFTSTSVFTCQRQLNMGQVVFLDFIAQCASCLCMVVWAFVQRGVWALVAGGFAFSLTRVLLSHRLNADQRDKLRWDPDSGRELLLFGRWVFASTFVSFAATQLDRPVLAKLISISELGVYSIALALSAIAIEVANRLSQSILFPLLSQHREDSQKIIHLCLQARHLLLWASGALCSAFAILSPLFFGLLYDSRYASAASLSQWLGVSVWSWILRATMDRIPLAMGRPRDLFFSNFINCAGIIFGILGFHTGRLPGFILGLSLGNLCAHVFLTVRLPLGRRAMLKQSLGFSLGWFAYSILAITTLQFLERHLTVEAPFQSASNNSLSAFFQSPAYITAALTASAAPCLLGAYALRRQLRMNFL